jgi:hypothetical protein
MNSVDGCLYHCKECGDYFYYGDEPNVMVIQKFPETEEIMAHILAGRRVVPAEKCARCWAGAGRTKHKPHALAVERRHDDAE